MHQSLLLLSRSALTAPKTGNWPKKRAGEDSGCPQQQVWPLRLQQDVKMSRRGKKGGVLSQHAWGHLRCLGKHVAVATQVAPRGHHKCRCNREGELVAGFTVKYFFLIHTRRPTTAVASCQKKARKRQTSSLHHARPEGKNATGDRHPALCPAHHIAVTLVRKTTTTALPTSRQHYIAAAHPALIFHNARTNTEARFNCRTTRVHNA